MMISERELKGCCYNIIDNKICVHICIIFGQHILFSHMLHGNPKFDRVVGYYARYGNCYSTQSCPDHLDRFENKGKLFNKCQKVTSAPETFDHKRALPLVKID